MILSQPQPATWTFGTTRLTTKSGTIFEQGDIVLVPVPFTDLSSVKRRPVVVLSGTPYNRRSRDVIVAAIKSNPATSGGIPIENQSLASGILPIKSYIRPGNVYTLSKGIIIKHRATVRKPVLEKVFSRVGRILDQE
ncbi:MAG: type II toxin-antitoxin system PemK/MazF family toxin [Candidatus Hydrogenedentes bacterium]|nr:type II toxin-antitoxin system PemK/MazF family toxin [Candidatus Hydrogenedentota bacterium]